MRDRHIPRLCRNCHSPMARQESSCWRCGTPWEAEVAPPVVLRVVAEGGAVSVPVVAVAAAGRR
jgi:predicted amidophosphoribosyltransferase